MRAYRLACLPPCDNTSFWRRINGSNGLFMAKSGQSPLDPIAELQLRCSPPMAMKLRSRPRKPRFLALIAKTSQFETRVGISSGKVLNNCLMQAWAVLGVNSMQMKFLVPTLRLAVVSLVAGALPQVTYAATVVYNNSAIFSSQLGASLLDTYSVAQGYSNTLYSDANMTAVVGQTAYVATRLSNYNLVGNNPSGETDGAYCAGCNGSFRLNFTGTSYTVGGGVFGAGFDVNLNFASNTYAFVTFANNATSNFLLAPQLTSEGFQPYFFGLTSDLGIASIHVGGLNGAVSGNTVAIDNLRIGSAAVTAAVPEPATWAMMLIGFGAIGFAMRRRKANSFSQNIRFSYT